MAKRIWPTKLISITSLHLDTKNPRLGRDSSSRSPREIIQYLFEHDKAIELAQSIATRDYFPNEPLLAIREGSRLVVVEGNRRLAALKALNSPELLEGAMHRQVEKLARQRGLIDSNVKVPVTTAPSRRSTDQQIAGRHIGTPVLAWQAENRAAFILEKIEEGYNNEDLVDRLGFTPQDIQEARQTIAIADMARSLKLPAWIKAKLDSPRAKVFTTIGRVFDSTVGREYLRVEPSAEHGIQGATAAPEFARALGKLVTDIASGNQSSRTLNTNSQIRAYFKGWKSGELPTKNSGTFVPSDVIGGKAGSSRAASPAQTKVRRSLAPSKTVVPRSFKVSYGCPRLNEIRTELTQLDRKRFRNAGAVLLRVFLELTILDYLERAGHLKPFIQQLKKKGIQLKNDTPSMKELRVEIVRIAKPKLTKAQANIVEKALRYDKAAPFGVDDLHSFVHQLNDLPNERDIEQFWHRTEPLFQLMLSHPV